jgi:outer membrane protein TolC
VQKFDANVGFGSIADRPLRIAR